MGFKVFNKNSVIIISAEGLYDGNPYIDGVILTKDEVDYLIRHLGDVIDARNGCQYGKEITLICNMPKATIVAGGEQIPITEMSAKSFDKSALISFVNSVPELTRWV